MIPPTVIPIDDILPAIGNGIEDLLPGYGFALIVFEFGVTSPPKYISNAKRADVVRLLLEAAHQLGADLIGTTIGEA
jgi:hypothetical protein